MKPAITLSQAMTDPQLFGNTFGAPSFWTWKVVARLIDGLPLTEPRELELFQQCTGRTKPPTKPVRRLILLAGRRAGKDRFMSSVAMWRAALLTNWKKYISVGEGAVVILIGADRKQAAILRRYCEGLLQAPLLARECRRQTGDIVEFRNGASLEIATNDARLVRGRSAIAVLGSECCQWRTEERSSSSNAEDVVSAALPSMAMMPDGGLLAMGSSVYRKVGFMYRMYRELHGCDDSDDSICWFAPSQVMNSRLPASAIEQAMANNAARARAEFLNIWREEGDDLFALDVLEGSTDYDVLERPPKPGIPYVCYADPASGTGKDSYGLAIAHLEADQARTAVLDVVRARQPKFSPAAVIATELAPLLRQYGITEVHGDRYAIGFHIDEWQRNGFRFIPCERTTSENYLGLLPLLLSSRSRLINTAIGRSQLASLERVVQSGGREIVRHPQVDSAHDDVAAVIAGALVTASQASLGMSAVSMSAWTAALEAASNYRYRESPGSFSENPPCHSFSRF
jgi:hypothetical protein